MVEFIYISYGFIYMTLVLRIQDIRHHF